MKLCRRISLHDWKLMRGGKHEVCTICKTVYPCIGDCRHLDCKADRGGPMPEWATLVSNGTDPARHTVAPQPQAPVVPAPILRQRPQPERHPVKPKPDDEPGEW